MRYMNALKYTWVVTIYSSNKDEKIDIQTEEAESLYDAVRLVLRFKPKRGYSIFKYDIERCFRLV